MNPKHLSQKKREAEKKAIKIAFIIGILVFISGTTAWIFYPEEINFKDCSSDVALQCGCPTDKSKVGGRKSIVFIDATDKIPKSRTQDINEIMIALSEPSGMVDTIVGGYERISAYVYSNQDPSDMSPIASFCRLPNKLVLSLKYSEAEINEQQKMIKKIAARASFVSSQPQKGTITKLIESVGVITGSGAYWNRNGKFILVSDLIERSSDCGFFDISAPRFQNISQQCNSLIKRALENMKGSKAYVCMIPRSDQPLLTGVVPFWQEYFQTVTGQPAKNTCDPSVIMGDRY